MTAWDDLGDLPRLLEPDALTSFLREGAVFATSAVPDHLRLKFGVNALVGVRLETSDGRLPGYVRTYADDAQARRVADKWRSMRVDDTPLGPGVRLLPGGSSVLYLFPNDARVRNLRVLLGNPRRLGRLLKDTALDGRHTKLSKSRFETLRYKPERRVVSAAHLVVDREPHSAVFRLRANGADPDLAGTAWRLHGALGSSVPRPLGAALGGELLTEEHIAGVALAAALSSGNAAADALAEVVARLHSSDISLPTRTDAAEILSSALHALDLLLHVDPSLDRAVTHLRGGLVSATPTSRSWEPLHGDLHVDQVILASQGPVVVDFERAVLGPAGHDLGNLIAHLRADGHDTFAGAFLDAYAAKRRIDTTGLAFYTACGLVQRALLAFRSVHPDWRNTVPHLLGLALEELHGRGPWDVCFPRRTGPWPAWTGTHEARRYAQFDPVGHTLVDAVPHNDDALPALGSLLDDGGTLVTYRPGHRAVVRMNGDRGARFVKAVPPRRARRLTRLASAMGPVAATTPGFPALADIVEADVDRGIVVFSELPGPTLRDLLLSDDGEDALPAVAAAVASFQAATIPEQIREGSGSRLEDWVGFVSDHAPALAPSYLRVLRTLPPAPDHHQPALAHGDLHDGNIVVGETGIGLLDLDGVTLADPAEDVGNLVAHLVLRALQRGDDAGIGHDQGSTLFAAYHHAGGTAAPEAVTSSTARTLFRLACVYRFRARWRHLCPLLLHEAERTGRPPTTNGPPPIRSSSE